MSAKPTKDIQLKLQAIVEAGERMEKVAMDFVDTFNAEKAGLKGKATAALDAYYADADGIQKQYNSCLEKIDTTIDQKTMVLEQLKSEAATATMAADQKESEAVLRNLKDLKMELESLEDFRKAFMDKGAQYNETLFNAAMNTNSEVESDFREDVEVANDAKAILWDLVSSLGKILEKINLAASGFGYAGLSQKQIDGLEQHFSHQKNG